MHPKPFLLPSLLFLTHLATSLPTTRPQHATKRQETSSSIAGTLANLGNGISSSSSSSINGADLTNLASSLTSSIQNSAPDFGNSKPDSGNIDGSKQPSNNIDDSNISKSQLSNNRKSKRQNTINSIAEPIGGLGSGIGALPGGSISNLPSELSSLQGDSNPSNVDGGDVANPLNIDGGNTLSNMAINNRKSKRQSGSAPNDINGGGQGSSSNDGDKQQEELQKQLTQLLQQLSQQGQGGQQGQSSADSLGQLGTAPNAVFKRQSPNDQLSAGSNSILQVAAASEMTQQQVAQAAEEMNMKLDETRNGEMGLGQAGNKGLDVSLERRQDDGADMTVAQGGIAQSLSQSLEGMSVEMGQEENGGLGQGGDGGLDGMMDG